MKVFLGLGGSGTDYPLEIKILLVGVDIIVILYSVSTLIGSNARLLSEKLKYIGLDTVFIGLIFSKVAYEFAVNFPYSLLQDFPLFQNIPFIELVTTIEGSAISHLRNIAVLIFFLLLLIFIGSYELRKYIIGKQKARLIEVVEREEEVLESRVEELTGEFELADRANESEEEADYQKEDSSSLEQEELPERSQSDSSEFEEKED